MADYGPFSPAQIDFSPLLQMGKSLSGGLEQKWSRDSLRKAMESGDYETAIKALLQAGDPENAAAVAKIRDLSEGGQNRYGLGLEFDQEGNAFRMGSHGDLIPVAPPGGGQFVQQQRWLNTGTGHQPVPAKGIPGASATVPIDVAGRKEAEGLGDIAAERGPAETRMLDLEANLDEMANATSEFVDLSDPNNPKPTEGLKRISGSYWGPIPASKVPNYPGGRAANTEAGLETLKTKIGFSALAAMREASKTGGALGQIAIQEGVWLQNSLEALALEQDPNVLARRIADIHAWTQRTKGRMRGSYNRTYGRQPQQAAPVTTTETPGAEVGTPETQMIAKIRKALDMGHTPESVAEALRADGVDESLIQEMLSGSP
jgi:hypothetical protein